MRAPEFVAWWCRSERSPCRAGRTSVRCPQPRCHGYRIPWAELLKKVFEVDVLECPECHGRLKVIAYVAEGQVAEKVLRHLGLEATGPPLARAERAPPDGSEAVPAYDLVDPVGEED